MEIRKLMDRYGRYYESLQRLGSIPLSEYPTIACLALRKGVIQRGYKEMKEESFKGNLIDYLCLISTEYVVYEYNKFVKDPCLTPFASFILEIYANESLDINNLMRLAMRHPKYLYDLIGSGKNDEKTLPSKIETFKPIYELWLRQYFAKA